MKVVHADKIEAKMASRHRVGGSLRQRLLDGPPLSIEGFSLVIARPKDRFSPRHRHNFDQFRFQIEGEADYSETGVLKAGMIGYFPEGVFYGPQKQGQGQALCVLTLQFGGASGGGYAGRDAVLQATAELEALGEFRGGAFFPRSGASGEAGVDGFQAVWEHLNKRPLTYPAGRYEVPILMDPDNSEWVPIAGQPGAYEKLMGVFTERRAMAEFIRIDPGASFKGGGGRDVFFVVSGAGTVAGEGYRRFSAAQLDPSDSIVFTATEPTELLHFRLPNLAGLDVAAAREAAE